MTDAEYRRLYEQNFNSIEPRYGNRDNRYYQERFERIFGNSNIKILDTKDQRIMNYIPMSEMSVSATASQSAVVKNDYRTVRLHTIEINSEDIDNLHSTLQQHQRDAELAYEIKRDNDNRKERANTARQFFAENPGIKEQYDELMVLCKLAGLMQPLL